LGLTDVVLMASASLPTYRTRGPTTNLRLP
jgi:hypothetical protein